VHAGRGLPGYFAAIVCAAARGVRGLGLLSPGLTATHRRMTGRKLRKRHTTAIYTPVYSVYLPCTVPYRKRLPHIDDTQGHMLVARGPHENARLIEVCLKFCCEPRVSFLPLFCLP